jgi:penicillin-binding protein 1A
MARRSPKPSRTSGRRAHKRRWPVRLLKGGLLFFSWSTLLALCFLGWLSYDLPDVGRLNEIRRQPSITLLANDGSALASYGDLYGQTLQFGDLPPFLPKAVLATEDRRFYRHFGLDIRGLLRAAYINAREWRLVQGGSTITQQLAKNIFLTPDRTVRRKGQEMLLAIWLERNFTKDEILALYLNRVYFGAGTYGVDAASRKFFGKSATRITPYEAAMLAGLLRAPSVFNPLSDPRAAAERAQLVLRNMVVAGMLSEADAKSIAAGGEATTKVAADYRSGRHFADWVLDQVSSYVGFVDRDLIVVTTLDPRLQRLAESNLAQILDESGSERNAAQGALVAMSPRGAIRAMVGGRDYAQSQFNRATKSLRQPGSAFKPFVFLAGLEQGYGPDSRFFDSPLTVDGWTPGNYENKYFGDVTLREAFARSLNSVAVQLSEQVGRRRVIEGAQRLGITSELTPGPSIALGSSGVSLLDLTSAYATFDNNGYGVWPHGIEQILDTKNEILYQREGSGPGRVVDPRHVEAMIDLMSAVVEWGTGKAATLGRPAAGKTGTGQEFRDAWFVGFTAELVTGVWVGNDDNSPMNKVTGGSLPAQIWRGFMAEALRDEPVRPLPDPWQELEIASAYPPDGTIGSDSDEIGYDSEQTESLNEWLTRVITQESPKQNSKKSKKDKSTRK